MAAAARLGYQGNWAARALATRRSGLIGWVVDAEGQAVLSDLLRGAASRFDHAGYACLVTLSSAMAVGTALPALLRRGAEAVIFVGAHPGSGDISAQLGASVPWLVIADGEAPDPRRIDLGMAAGLDLAVRYLMELGHQRLTFLLPGTAPSRALARADRQRDPPGSASPILSSVRRADPNATKSALGELLAGPERPTAIVCCSDTDAVIALRECALRGIPVPEALSIVGFGDEAFARHTVPALTTVRCALRQIGEQAAAAILGLIEGISPEPRAPAVKLVIRESAGRAPR